MGWLTDWPTPNSKHRITVVELEHRSETARGGSKGIGEKAKCLGNAASDQDWSALVCIKHLLN
jgi:hypothetical protein